MAQDNEALFGAIQAQAVITEALMATLLLGKPLIAALLEAHLQVEASKARETVLKKRSAALVAFEARIAHTVQLLGPMLQE